MEVDTSSDTYVIKNAKIPIRLSLRRIRDLIAHEETVRRDLDSLITLLTRDPVLRHPLVADDKTGLVLDGTHRLAALRELGCELAPCALVDYRHPRIVIDRWFRKIEGTSLGTFKSQIAGIQHESESNSSTEDCLSTRACYAALENRESRIVFPTSENDPVDLAKASFEIERIARSSGLKVTYEDAKSIAFDNGFVMSTIRVTKEEILNASSQKRAFPPKTTRHVIPSRPLGVGIILAWLKQHDLAEAQGKFLKHLEAKSLTRKPEGSWVGSRRYQEEVLLFV